MDKFLKNSNIKNNQKNGIELSTTSEYVVDVFFSFDESKLSNIDTDNLIKLMWYYRDIRNNGKGRRDEFKLILKEVLTRGVTLDLSNIVKYGRFKDIMDLLKDKSYLSLHNDLLKVIKDNWDNNLLKKYLPQQSKDLAKLIIKAVYNIDGVITPSIYKKYRKHKASYHTVERQLTLKEKIDFEKVPSVCMKIHGRPRKAFENDFYSDDFHDYKNKLATGEAKINTSAITPVDIYKEYKRGLMNEVLEAQLNQYKFEFDGDVLTVIDTSGSMGGDPENIARGLGVFLMRRNKGRFHNLSLIFAGEPQIYKIDDKDTYEESWRNLPEIHEQSTQISKVFAMMQELAEDNANLPKAIVLFSDMQFDSAYDGYTKTEYNKWKNILKDQFPQIIFWNCNESINDSFPVKFDEQGTILLGGNNPRIFFDVMDKINNGQDITPLSFVMDVLNQYPSR
jgi:hypothetical protein